MVIASSSDSAYIRLYAHTIEHAADWAANICVRVVFTVRTRQTDENKQ
jgi:phosphate uptake regulator